MEEKIGYEKIKQLIEDVNRSKLTSFEIDFPDGTKIRMESTPSTLQTPIIQQFAGEKEEKKIEKIGVGEEKEEEKGKGKETDDSKEGNLVTSPIVGTFYLRPSPNATPYVEVGKKVKKGDILCIIEAMKLMNEIESEYDGEIAEILLKDGDMVEYGKPLFRIK
mgnify:CR=1 FL=1